MVNFIKNTLILKNLDPDKDPQELAWCQGFFHFFLHNITFEDPLSQFLKKLLRDIELFFCPINSGFKHFQKHRVTEYVSGLSSCSLFVNAAVFYVKDHT